ncbi:MAG: MarR family winged helix-turn-helix transcriptional regulator [Thiotrichales bacterium]
MAMNQTAALLERLGALLQLAARDDASRHGLLPIHIQVLHYLAQANRYSDLPIAIAEYFGVTRGTVSQTLAVLERKGLLNKTPDPCHGKRLHLELTPAGVAVLSGSWPERIEQALRDLPLETEMLEDTLRKLLQALQHLNGQRAFGICHQCAHFLTAPETAHCGLTGEALAPEQTQRLCREWTAPAEVSERAT